MRDGAHYIYGYVNGELMSVQELPGSGCTVYRYKTRSSRQETAYSDWSEYGETVYTASDSCEVRTMVFYKYCDKIQTTTYVYERWTDWTEYTPTPMAETETTQVETIVQYRFKSKS